MSELRNAMQARAEDLESSLQTIEEFDAPTAHKAIRRRHNTRHALQSVGIIAAVGLLAGGGWLGQGMLSDARETTPGVSTEPSTDPTLDSDITYAGRNPEMGDAEAVSRASNPATGEVWLTQPQEVNPGAWAASEDWNGFWGEPTWYLIGHRDGNEIISLNGMDAIVEVSPDGTARVIAAPAPYQASDVVLDAPWPIEADTTIYYDSLALPATFTTPEGDVLSLRTGLAPVSTGAPENIESLATVGGNEIVRGTRATDADAWGAEVAGVLDGSVSEVRYFVRTPFGALQTPSIVPVAGAVDWAEGYGTFTDGVFVDFFDNQCLSTLEYSVAAAPGVGGEWLDAGTVDGRTVRIPALSNTLGQEMYKTWSNRPENSGGKTSDSSEAFSHQGYLNAPAVIAIETSDPNLWWLALNSKLSTRDWC